MLKEIRIIARKVHRPDLESLFSECSQTNKALRNQAICLAHFEYGYHQKEIANHLGLHYTTVSNLVRKNTKIKDLTPLLTPLLSLPVALSGLLALWI